MISKNHGIEHNKSLKGLRKAGLNGLLITDNGDKTYVSLIGKMDKALAVTHMAMLQTDWLKQMAKNLEPKVSMTILEIGKEYLYMGITKVKIEKKEGDRFFFIGEDGQEYSDIAGNFKTLEEGNKDTEEALKVV